MQRSSTPGAGTSGRGCSTSTSTAEAATASCPTTRRRSAPARRWLGPRGVTSFLISTSGADHAEIVGRLSALRGVVGPVAGGATVRGFHLEGPYINPVRKGAFPPRWLRAPSVDEYLRVVRGIRRDDRANDVGAGVAGGGRANRALSSRRAQSQRWATQTRRMSRRCTLSNGAV